VKDALPTLRGERVSLRQLREEDADALFHVFSDPEVTRYWSSPPMTDRIEARALLAEIDTLREEGTLLQWGIVEAGGGSVVGTATLADINREHRRAELGFALRRGLWGRGLASEAVSLLLDQAFGAMGLHRIEADTDPGNQSAMRLLERLGFRREGYLPQRWFVGGQWHDTVLFGLLKPDWRPDRRVENEGRRDA
jgi:RimJ/RimL family protein N-acetyltransferase